MNSLDSLPMTITCPTCLKKVTNTVGWFRKANQSCPHGCGTTFKTDGQFRRGVAEADRELDNLKRQMGNIRINIQL